MKEISLNFFLSHLKVKIDADCGVKGIKLTLWFL